MKEPERLIRKYYSDNNITHGATILFSYIRKSTTGGDWAIIEYYAARYGRLKNGKGKDIAIKLVMRFNPDTYRYSVSDSVIKYDSYSIAYPSHLIYDFHTELKGCRDYIRMINGNESDINRLHSYRNWKYFTMPTSEIPLNDFSGTKYQYCKYLYKDEYYSIRSVRSYSYWGKNPYGSLPDYLRKFNINPQAMEIFASIGMTKYMNDNFLIRLRDDVDFSRWYKRHAKMTLGWSITSIYNQARRDIGKTCWEIVYNEERRLERIRNRKRLERQEIVEIRRKKEIEKKMLNERRDRKERILNLYNTIKSICKKYGAYEVVVPKSEREMKREGKKMHNCIGDMYPMRQGINAIVLFLYKNGKSFVDIEIDPHTFKVVQCRRTCNALAEKYETDLANKIAKEIKEIYKKAA